MSENKLTSKYNYLVLKHLPPKLSKFIQVLESFLIRCSLNL